MSKQTFEQLKLALQVTPIFRTPYWNKPFLVYCDAFGEAVGSILSQLDENGHDHPIHFASRQLTSTEKNYIMTEHEGFVVIFSFKKFRHYLLGYKAKILTDHAQGLNLLGQQAQSKWSTCLMVTLDGGF